MLLSIKTLTPDINSFTTETIDISVQRRGIPSFDVLGVPDKVANGIRHRIKTALSTAHIKLPASKILISFSKYNNTLNYHYYDLQIVVALLEMFGIVQSIDKICFFGELNLDGTIKECDVPTLYYEFCVRNKYHLLLLNASTLMTLNDTTIKCYKVTTIADTLNFFAIPSSLPKITISNFEHLALTPSINMNGNLKAKRCLEIAISGRHNMLMLGPPGVGKTTLASFITYLHTASLQKYYDIYIQNILNGENIASSCVPIISPSLGINYRSLFGREPECLNSMLLNANNGFLFMDEFLEFPTKYLESLKKILDEKRIGKRSCDFTLIAACNPCICGNYGSSMRKCTCTPGVISRYRSKLSGGLLDRFHLMTYIDANEADLLNKQIDTWYLDAKKRIEKAFQITEFSTFIPTKSKNLLEKARDTYKLSHRTLNNLLSVTQTIAKLECSTEIKEAHLLEALSFRVDFYQT